MAYDIGPRIGIDGEAEFRKELQSINQGVRTLGSEMKAVTSEFIGNEKSVEALTAQNDVLDRTILSLTEKLGKQKQMLQASAQAYGEADERTQKWQQAVNNTTADLNKAKAELKQNKAAIDEYSGAEDEAATSTEGFAAALSGPLSAAASAGVFILKELAEAAKQAVAFLADAAREGAAYADEILTLSTNYGIATDKLQEYQYMAELTDTSLDTITGSMSRLTRTMSSARDGSGDAAAAFERLGISIIDSNGNLRDADSVFGEAIDALGSMQEGTERDALAMEIFGRSAQDLNSLIAAGADGIRAYADEARNMGYVLTDEQLSSLGALDDQFQRMDRTIEMIKNQLAAGMAPALVDLTQVVLDFAQSINWEEVGRSIGNVLQTVADMARSVDWRQVGHEATKTLEAVVFAVEAVGIAIKAVVDLLTTLILAIKDAAVAFKELFQSAGIPSTGSLSKVSSGSISALRRQASGGSRMDLATPLPSSQVYGAVAALPSNSAQSGNINLNITSEIDGQVLARNQYSYNVAEQQRRGRTAVGR